MTETNMKKLHIICFQLYEIQENAKLETVERSVVPVLGWWEEKDEQEAHRGLLRVVEIPCMIPSWWVPVIIYLTTYNVQHQK